jgi:hypothetical protein
MPIVIADRVKVTTTTTGTGTLTLGSAVTGFQDFGVIGDGNETYYTISVPGGADFEVGIGTFTASGTTLSRDTILTSSNGGLAVNLSAGTKDVFVTYPAERSVISLDGNNSEFQSGTKMLFAQTTAPLGWTKDVTNYDNNALRVVTGTAGSGGTVDFTTAFANRSVTGSIGNTTATNQSTTATNQNTTATNNNTTATNNNTTATGSIANTTAINNNTTATNNAATQGGTVGNTTLTTTTIPSHQHVGGTYVIFDMKNGAYGTISNVGIAIHQAARWDIDNQQQDLHYTNSIGSSGAHNHSFSGSSHNHTQNAHTHTQNAHNHTFTGTAHTHTQNAHTHTQNAHTHTQDAHNHTQDAHNHAFTGDALDFAVKYLDVILCEKD